MNDHRLRGLKRRCLATYHDGDGSPGTGTGFGGATTFGGQMSKYSGRAKAYGESMFSTEQSGANGREGPLGPYGSYNPTQDILE